MEEQTTATQQEAPQGQQQPVVGGIPTQEVPQQNQQTPPPPEPVKKRHSPLLLILLIIVLLGIFLYGLKWVFGLGQEQVGSAPFLIFDYAVGLTMIFLPCTLPLAFVIVPLVMGKSYQKGIGMALAFGVGVTITLSFYGVLIGLLGQALGIHQVETAKNILYALAGLFAVLFALGELGLIPFHSPAYSGAVPGFIMKQKDLLKAGLLGLFLGNVGVGCPNPLFNAVIVPQIVVTGSPFQGWLIMFVQALGRITPLFILAFLAILGINATKFLVAHKDTVTKFTGWTTVFVGGFLLTLGLFGHDWWVISGQHTLFELVTQENFITNLLGSKVQQLGHTHGIPTGTGLFGLPIALGTPFILLVWIFPMLWYFLQRKKGVEALTPEQQPFEKRYLGLLGWFFIVVSLLLYTVFGYLLPHMYLQHWSKEAMHHGEQMTSNKIVSDFHVSLSSSPSIIQVGKPFILRVVLHDKNGKSITDLQISHERILHVILVSEDLEEFEHVHPEDSKTFTASSVKKGEFEIPLTLSKSERYRVLIDANRAGKEVSDLAWLTVGGKSQLLLVNKDLTKTKVFGQYTVTLTCDPSGIQSGKEIHLNYHIMKDGKPILDIQPYLGADMHLAIMPIDLSIMAHTHGFKEDKTKPIDAHYTFPYAGLWKIYSQFKHQGKVITAEFMIEVTPGTQTTQQESMPHTH